MHKLTKDLTGQRFGKLVVLNIIEERRNLKILWECICDCGNKIIVTGQDLKRGHSKSCGCLLKNNKYEIKDNYAIGYTNKEEEFLIDIEDLENVKQYTWLKKRDYIQSQDKNHNNIFLHRLIMKAKENEIVDHINHNPSDNRKINLRLCNSSENQMNKKIQSNNKSGITGVFWDTKRNAWKSSITINKKRIDLGWFDNFNDAVQIRKKAELKYFKEYQYKKCDDVRFE